MSSINFIKKRTPRTRRYLIGASSSIVSQGITSAISFVIIGILARYFSPEEFGIWSLISSFLGVFISLDLGFGNSLKNELSQLYSANGPHYNENARVMFLSMFYALLVWFSLCAGLIYFLRDYIPWNLILKTSNSNLLEEGKLLLTLVAISFAVTSAFQIYSNGFYSFQETQYISLFNIGAKVTFFMLLIVAVNKQIGFFDVNLINLGIIFLFSFVGLVTFLLRRRWGIFKLKVSQIVTTVKRLYSHSFQFAALQVLAVIGSNIDLFLVSNKFGLVLVGDYSLVKRIYLFTMSFHSIALFPLWPAFTEAVHKKDFEWIKRSLSRILIATVLLFALQVLFFFVYGDSVIYLWSGKTVELSSTFFWFGIYFLVIATANIFSVFLNSINVLKWQIIISAITLTGYIPLARLLTHWIGINGVILTFIILSLPGILYLILHTRKIILGYTISNKTE